MNEYLLISIPNVSLRCDYCLLLHPYASILNVNPHYNMAVTQSNVNEMFYHKLCMLDW